MLGVRGGEIATAVAEFWELDSKRRTVQWKRGVDVPTMKTEAKGLYVSKMNMGFTQFFIGHTQTHLVLCMARPEAVSQAKPGPNRPGQAGPK